MPDILATAAPLEIHTERVRPEWIDHNGHMNVAYYLMAFDEAAGAVSKAIGYTNEYRKANNIGTFVGDYHIRYVQEVMEGDLDQVLEPLLQEHQAELLTSMSEQ